MATVFAVVVDGNDDLGPFDAIYGYDAVTFRKRSDATAKARFLSSTGDWPGGQPSYRVDPVDEDRMPYTHNMHFSRGIK